ncbi:MAG TPA: CopG family antitoxin [Gemmataceae bacterium]|nr:CopG family antitoxin [Gemmataceae bacterium]
MTIDEFIWPKERVEHIARHGVTPEEVEAVCFGKPLDQRKARVPEMEKPLKKTKLPHTDSIKKLAEFWDSHDLTDFEDELEEVSKPVFRRRKVIEVALAADEVEAVERMAQAEGLGREELIRQWVLQKVAHRKTSCPKKRRR